MKCLSLLQVVSALALVRIQSLTDAKKSSQFVISPIIKHKKGNVIHLDIFTSLARTTLAPLKKDTPCKSRAKSTDQRQQGVPSSARSLEGLIADSHSAPKPTGERSSHGPKRSAT